MSQSIRPALYTQPFVLWQPMLWQSLRSGLACFLSVLLWFGIAPKIRFTRVLEVVAALIGLAILLMTRWHDRQIRDTGLT